MRAKLDQFFASQGRRWSPATRSRYAWYLGNLASWLEESEIPSEAEGITERMLIRWLDARGQWAPTTQYVAIVACRAFFRWAVGRETSPAEQLVLPKRILGERRTLDEIRMLTILATLDTSTPKGLRDTSLLLLLLDTGLRAAEVCRLRVDMVDLNRRTFTVQVKGGRWASGVFGIYAGGTLADWMSARRIYARASTRELYVSLGGLIPGTRLTTDGLRAIFRQIGAKAGCHFSPHDLRRTFATMALRNGAPSRLVQIAGRWDSIEMVETYTQALRAEDFEPYSPANALMGLGRHGESRTVIRQP